VARLERSLGLPLFERLGKSLQPTEAGEALTQEAASLIGSAERLAEVVRARREGQRGRLRVGASTTPGLYLLPAVLRAFRERHPDVDVRYAVENSRQIEEKIVRNDLDLGFVGAHLSHAALRLRPVVDDEIVWYAAASDARTRGTSRPRDLERTTCVVRESGSATRKLVDGWLRRARVRPTDTIVISCPEAAKALVRAGLGVAYMSARGLDGDGGSGLRRLTFDAPRLSRPIFLVTHADKRVSPPMQAFLALARSALRARGPRSKAGDDPRA
jgi:LysR family transcriptional regulator, transcriptional activator of the cysJI operon